jgi:hypothetical protein
MTTHKLRNAGEPVDFHEVDYFDFLPAIGLYETKGDASGLDECIGACIEIGPDEVGRPITKEVCAMIGAAFVRRSLRGAGAPAVPWRNSLPLARAIALAYAEALHLAQARRGRDKVPRTNREWAADYVRGGDRFKRLRLTRRSVWDAVTAARKNSP